MTLKSMRSATGLSASKAATEVGIAQSTLTRYEKANRLPDYAIANKLAELYQQPKDDLAKLVRPPVKKQKPITEEQSKPVPAEAEPIMQETDKPVPAETEPPTPQIKTVTDADYVEACEQAVKALKRMIGVENNKSILLAVAFVTAEIENRLFIEKETTHDRSF